VTPTWWTLMRWDLRLLRRQRMALAAAWIMLSAFALALLTGQQHSSQLNADAQSAFAAAASDRNKLLQRIEAGDKWAAMAISARANMLLSPPPLAALASGRSDLDPHAAKASVFTQGQALFSNYQLDSPVALALGRFDLAFVALALLPLLVIALGHGLLAEDRELGLDRMLAMQGRHGPSWLAARATLRAGSMSLCLLAAMALLALLSGTTGEWLRWLLALLLIGGYIAFWWGITVWVGSWGWSEGRTLFALLLLWAVVVLAIPAVVGSISRHGNPPPSRFALIAAARAAEVEASKRSNELLGAYSHDHPELDAAVSADLPSWARTGFLISAAVDNATAPLMHDFDRALQAQQHAVARWQFASPALMLQRSLLRVAGTDESRSLAFRDQAQRHLSAFRERVGASALSGVLLDEQRLQALPTFVFVEPPLAEVLRPVLAPMLAMWISAVLFMVLTWQRVRRPFSAD